MADDRPDDEPEVDEDATEPKAAEGKDLDSLTDRVEEAPQALSGGGNTVQEALARLMAAEAERSAAAAARERALAAVRLVPADVDLVAAELEMDKKEAERLLKEHEGDVAATLRKALLAV